MRGILENYAILCATFCSVKAWSDINTKTWFTQPITSILFTSYIPENWHSSMIYPYFCLVSTKNNQTLGYPKVTKSACILQQGNRKSHTLGRIICTWLSRLRFPPVSFVRVPPSFRTFFCTPHVMSSVGCETSAVHLPHRTDRKEMPILEDNILVALQQRLCTRS